MAKRSQTGQRKPPPTPVVVPDDSRLVQTRIPRTLYDRIEKCAGAELISVAAYIRRTLQNTVPGG